MDSHISDLKTRLLRHSLQGYLWLRKTLAWVPLSVLIGMCLGLTLHHVLHLEQRNQLLENDLLVPHVVALHSLAGVILVFLLGVWMAWRVKRHGEKESLHATFARLNRRGTIVVVVPLFFYLRSGAIGEKYPFFALIVGALIGLITVLYVHRQRWKLPENPHWTPWLTRGLLAVFILVWVWFIVGFEILHHQNLGTRAWDLGLYVNTMWRSLHGNPLGCSLLLEGTHAYRHFDPILVLISPIFLIYPETETAFVFQALWIASAAIPLYLIATTHLRSSWLGLTLATIYLMHPALHGPSIYDFHSLVLAGPLAIWCVYLLQTGRTKTYFAALSLLLLCREEMAVLGLLLGIFAGLTKRPPKVVFGTIALSVVYGLAVYVLVVSRGASYTDYFEDIRGENRRVLSNLFIIFTSNPVYLLRYMLDEPKIIYTLKLLVPLLCLPLFSGTYRVLFLLGLGVTLLGSKNSFFSLSMQYSTWWLPFMAASIPAAIENIVRRRHFCGFRFDAAAMRVALMTGALASAVAMSTLYGVFWPNPSFRAGYEWFERNPTQQMRVRYQSLRKAKELIPRSASVMASEHVVPHFAARSLIWSFERPSTDGIGLPDYIVLNEEEITQAQKGKGRRSASMQKIIKKNYEELQPQKNYRVLLKENGMVVYQRKDLAPAR